MEFHPLFEHCHINSSRLAELAIEWRKDDFEVPNWRLPVYPEEDNGNFIQFLGISTALQFCFRDPETKEKFTVDWQGVTWSGSMALNACLMRALNMAINVLDAEFLKNLCFTQADKIFESVHGEIPLLRERWLILRELGEILHNRFGGRFENLLQEANYNAATHRDEKTKIFHRGVVELLVSEFPYSYSDRSFQNSSGKWLEFHKKANLFCVLYQGRAADSNGKLPILKSIGKLIPITDYQVPRTLHKLGILVYSTALEQKIKDQIEIPKNSEEEQEIRAATFLAINKMLEIINSRRMEDYQKSWITICHLDYRLWTAGRDCKLPHHITMTTAY